MTAQDKTRQILVLVVSLVGSIAVPVILNRSGVKTSTQEDVIIASALFSAFLLIELSVVARDVADRERREQELWLLHEACDSELLNVSRCFVRLTRESYGSRDLFVAHFRQEIHRLAESIGEVAERRQLRVQADHFLTVDNVLDAFQGDTERLWRYTWAIDSGATPLFDELAWKRYFERTAAMVGAGEIKEARTILVISDPQLIQTPRIQKLLDFFHTNNGFVCCLVSREHFRTLCTDNSVPGSYIDFGIYGNRLLFLTEQYEPEIVGIFTKDPALIQHYSHLFDSMWDSPSVARKNPSAARDRVSIEELYRFDETPHP